MKKLVNKQENIVTISDIVKNPKFVGLLVTKGQHKKNQKFILTNDGEDWMFVNDGDRPWVIDQSLELVLDVTMANAEVYQFETLKEFAKWILNS